MNGEAWGVAAAAELVAEIDAELAERSAADEELVTKGRLHRSEADYRKTLVADIRADLAAAFAPLQPGETANDSGQWRPRPDRAIAWADKVRWINGELDDRNASYPELVRKGRLTERQAHRRIRAIEALRRLYWEKLFMWEPPAGPAQDYLAALRSTASAGLAVTSSALFQSEGARIYRELVRRHFVTVGLEADGQGRLVA